MKNSKTTTSTFSPLSFVIAGLLVVFFVFDSKATVYTTISDGSYNDCAIWDNGCPANSIPVGDTVIINHNVDASS